MPPITLRILAWYKAMQERDRQAVGRAWVGQRTVFCQPKGGVYFRSQIDDVFVRTEIKLGIEGATLHTFRHTVSTSMQESDQSLKAAQELLGHATERTTHRVYTHTTDDAKRRVAWTMEETFGDVDMPFLKTEER
jgi:integrase